MAEIISLVVAVIILGVGVVAGINIGVWIMSDQVGQGFEGQRRELEGTSLGPNLQSLLLDFIQGNGEALLASGTWNWNTEASKTLLVGAPALYQPVITKIVLIAQVGGIVTQAIGGETISIIDDDSTENIFANWFSLGAPDISSLGNLSGKFDVEGGICSFGPPEGGRRQYESAWTVLTGNLVGSISGLLPGSAPVYYMVFGIRSPPII